MKTAAIVLALLCGVLIVRPFVLPLLETMEKVSNTLKR